jgi:hypothetical protein
VHPLPWRIGPRTCSRRPSGVRGSGGTQAFGRATSADCLGSPLLNITQFSDGLRERGKPGDQGHHRQRAVAADSGGCS